MGVVAVVGSNWFDGLCVCGSVDGLMGCVCVALLLVCGWVVAKVAGSFGFFFFFFNMGFCSGGILVSSGQWWLGFFWVFVSIGLCLCLCLCVCF